MALEGASQLSEKSRTLYGSRFRDASFQRGLIVLSDEEGAVKTSLSFLPETDSQGLCPMTSHGEQRFQGRD